jgi:hypothetical protein
MNDHRVTGNGHPFCCERVSCRYKDNPLNPSFLTGNKSSLFLGTAGVIVD